MGALDPSSTSRASREPADRNTPSGDRPVRVAILDRGDREVRRRSAPEESRFLPLFRALAARLRRG